MDIRVLQYFLTVAREESITRAAEAFRMKQPTLSRQLKDLKDKLGKNLSILQEIVSFASRACLKNKYCTN